MKKRLNIPKPEDCIWFAFADYPEIEYLRMELTNVLSITSATSKARRDEIHLVRMG